MLLIGRFIGFFMALINTVKVLFIHYPKFSRSGLNNQIQQGLQSEVNVSPQEIIL